MALAMQSSEFQFAQRLASSEKGVRDRAVRKLRQYLSARTQSDTGYVFCMLHRLPEQHDCTFDHMGRGREEAIMKMVKLDRKVGRSCQRIGEGCS